MQRFRNILLVLPGFSETDFIWQRGIRLARSNGAQLRIMDVLPSVPGNAQSYRPFPDAPPISDLILEERRRALTQLIETEPELAPQVSLEVRFGTLFLEVTRAVLREGFDLVLIPSPAEGEESGRLRAEVMHLIRKCPAEVWAVREDVGQKFKRILAAVDIGEETDPGTGRELNRKVLQLASSLAGRENADLHVVHAWNAYAERALRSYAVGRGAVVDEYVEDTRLSRTQTLKAFLGENLPPDTRVFEHLEHGDPSDVLPELLRRISCDLLVMGTVCRTRVAGFIIGNTAETVFHRVSCSVMAVKPAEFQSPVRLEE